MNLLLPDNDRSGVVCLEGTGSVYHRSRLGTALTILLDSHVLHWWSSEPERLTPAASRALSEADQLAVADITWFELAWLANRERIVLTVPIASWLEQLSEHVRTIGATPAIALTAVDLPSNFPGDTADRLIYATAIDKGWRLVTKDGKLRRHKHPARSLYGNDGISRASRGYFIDRQILHAVTGLGCGLFPFHARELQSPPR